MAQLADEKAKSRGKTRAAVQPDKARAALSDLEREDSAIRDHLLDAAVAGATLARDPADRDLRGEAARAWQALAAGVAHHLASEDDMVLPYAAAQDNIPPAVMNRARERQRKLRRLAKTVAGVDFESASTPAVKRAARALLRLAVHLDDLIDGEERELFPILQRSLFEARPG